MIIRGNTKSRFFKVLDKLDAKDNDINKEVLIVIKGTEDNDYYFIDDKGNKIPTTQAIADRSIFDSRGRLRQPHLLKVEVVDNEHLESAMYDVD